MEELICVLNEIERDGIVDGYAIGGAFGVLFYTEAFNTKDVDVFVVLKTAGSGIVHLGGIYERLKRKGYKMEGQHFVIGGVPVDFLAVYDDLTGEAVKNAVVFKYGRLKVKVASPEYLAAIALKTGRRQDLRKIDFLLGSGKLNRRSLNGVLKRHGLYSKWSGYVKG